jgi:hypothetical protein
MSLKENLKLLVLIEFVAMFVTGIAHLQNIIFPITNSPFLISIYLEVSLIVITCWFMAVFIFVPILKRIMNL